MIKKTHEEIYQDIKESTAREYLRSQRDILMGMVDFAIAANETEDFIDVVKDVFETASREGNIAAIKNTAKVYNAQKDIKDEENICVVLVVS